MIAKLAATRSENLKDLESKLYLRPEKGAYTLKAGREPEDSWLGSILTTMLDPQTRRDFVNEGRLL